MEQHKHDHNLTKLKLTLAVGGLAATMIGAGLLSREAGAQVASSVPAAAPEPAATSSNRTSVTIDSIMPEDLNLNLEAIPTVAAPVMRRAPVAMGRSSG